MADTRAACGRLRVACVGDSLTRGDGLHEHPPSHRVSSSEMRKRRKQFAIRMRGNYPAILARLLPRADVRNFGHGGATACAGGDTPYHRMREYGAALRFQPHVVVLMLGTNDAKGRHWRGSCRAPSASFAAGLTAIIDAFFALASPPRLLVALQPPTMLARRVYGIELVLLDSVRKEVADVVAQQRRAGRLGVTLAPALPTTGLDARFFTDDRLHLSANGTAVLACAAHDALRLVARPSLHRMMHDAADAQRRDSSAASSPSNRHCRAPRPRSCWDPFCTDDHDAAAAEDDGASRQCEADSGALAPFVLTGMACSGGGRAARAACRAVRTQFGLARPAEDATAMGAKAHGGPQPSALAAEGDAVGGRQMAVAHAVMRGAAAFQTAQSGLELMLGVGILACACWRLLTTRHRRGLSS